MKEIDFTTDERASDIGFCSSHELKRPCLFCHLDIIHEFQTENAALRRKVEDAKSFLRTIMPFIPAQFSVLRRDIESFLIDGPTLLNPISTSPAPEAEKGSEILEQAAKAIRIICYCREANHAGSECPVAIGYGEQILAWYRFYKKSLTPTSPAPEVNQTEDEFKKAWNSPVMTPAPEASCSTCNGSGREIEYTEAPIGPHEVPCYACGGSGKTAPEAEKGAGEIKP
jgi:hypothetical protein